MAKFRKKPVLVEAVKFVGVDTKGAVSFEEMPEWLSEAIGSGKLWLEFSLQGPQICVGTLEGDMIANMGDWIIQGVEGELYPCKPGIFAATYEPA